MCIRSPPTGDVVVGSARSSVCTSTGILNLLECEHSQGEGFPSDRWSTAANAASVVAAIGRANAASFVAAIGRANAASVVAAIVHLLLFCCSAIRRTLGVLPPSLYVRLVAARVDCGH